MEKVSTLERERFVSRGLIWDTFGWYVWRYYFHCGDEIPRMRSEWGPRNADHTLYQDVEEFYPEMLRMELAERNWRRKMGFVPIGVEEYVKLHMESNPDEDPATLLESIRRCVSAALAGARCHCGEPIWVIGSAFAGHACFTCITGEGFPSEDYEIDEVLEARQASPERPGWPA